MEYILEHSGSIALMIGALYLLVKWFGSTDDIDNAEHQKTVELVKRMVHVVSQEERDGVYYWFDSDTGAFIAQGRNFDEIVSILKIRFPKDAFVISEDSIIVGSDFELIKITGE